MRRFFSDDSFWNQPIGDNPAIDPGNDHFLNVLNGEYGGSFWINCKEYAIPVYVADSTTPRYEVHQRGWDHGGSSRWGKRERYWSQGPGFGHKVPIPDAAIPDPGTDAHLAVVDWNEGLVWDMWACRKRPDGEWESRTGMVYPVDSSGVWRTEDFAVKDDDSIHFHGPSRAAGVPLVAGLAMKWELLSGRVEHKIAMATWHNAFKQFVAPATWTDGFEEGGLPEGAVMQLDPDLDLKSFGLSRAAMALACAMQVYGMVNVDNAQGNVVYTQGFYGGRDGTWDGILEPDELKRIPLEKYRVLKLGPITHKGDCYKKSPH